MYSLLFLIAFLLGGSFCIPANSARSDDELSAEQVRWFETNIRPILATKCYSCHSARDDKDEGGLTLDTRMGWEKGGDHGPALVPKNADASLLIRAIRYSDSDLEMPPDKKLSDRQIKLLEQWVNLGAPDPRNKVVSNTKRNSVDPIAGRSHWAFQPLSNNRPRRVDGGEGWIKSPIDLFIWTKLRTKQLSPNRCAEKRTLAQRVSLLLVGLPLTKPELDRFANDESEDAYEKLVERLLASPQFGEVWGRHWLDLARYADSNGLDENFLFREAWRYRNWVINAINLDQPFDEFTREQIAGDLMSHDTIEQRDRQRIGSGFLVVGPKVLLGVNGELQKMDVADELISTVGTTFLGQTLGCARCHDHKFDPIPTEDYYALAGIFTSTEVMQTRYMLGQQRKMERLFGLGEDENKVNAAYEKYWREQKGMKKRFEDAVKVQGSIKDKETEISWLLKNHVAALAPDLKKKLEASAAMGFKKLKELQLGDAKKQTEKKLPLDHKTAIAIHEKHIAKLRKELFPPPAIPPRAMIPVDKPKPGDESIRLSGQFNRKGDSVSRGFLQVLTDAKFEIPEKQSGRMELAKWLVDVDKGAGRLTARVLVNRIWHHLIGKGIVRTTDNFGRTGETPSHPELLDFLARELIESDWSIKHVIRLIVLSQTFQQSSEHSEAAHEIDPDNRLVWRANRRRLTAEAFRDRMLMVSNQLDQRPMNSSVNYLGDQATAVGANKNRRKTNFPNRSIYLPVIRNDLPEIFEAFDYANDHRPTGNRPETTVATTGLYILNDPMMLNTSRALASELVSQPGTTDKQRARRLFEQILAEDPIEYEVDQVLNYVKSLEKLALKELENSVKQPKKPNNQKNAPKSGSVPGKSKKDKDKPATEADPVKKRQTESKIRAWATACHALFASSRFQILE